MDYDPNEKYSYWKDELPLDMAIGVLLGLILYAFLSGTGVLGA